MWCFLCESKLVTSTICNKCNSNLTCDLSELCYSYYTPQLLFIVCYFLFSMYVQQVVIVTIGTIISITIKYTYYNSYIILNHNEKVERLCEKIYCKNTQFANITLKFPSGCNKETITQIQKWQKDHQVQKYKRKSIPKALKQQVWCKIYPHSLAAKCTICFFNEISSFNFHVGHIVSLANGGSNSLDNLLPICSSCNLSCSTQNLHDFKNQFFSC